MHATAGILSTSSLGCSSHEPCLETTHVQSTTLGRGGSGRVCGGVGPLYSALTGASVLAAAAAGASVLAAGAAGASGCTQARQHATSHQRQKTRGTTWIQKCDGLHNKCEQWGHLENEIAPSTQADTNLGVSSRTLTTPSHWDLVRGHDAGHLVQALAHAEVLLREPSKEPEGVGGVRRDEQSAFTRQHVLGTTDQGKYPEVRHKEQWTTNTDNTSSKQTEPSQA